MVVRSSVVVEEGVALGAASNGRSLRATLHALKDVKCKETDIDLHKSRARKITKKQVC